MDEFHITLTSLERGIQEDVPLPTGVTINRFAEGDWQGYHIFVGGLMAGDYGIDPPPNDEQVKNDLLSGLANPGPDVIEDVDQVIAYLRVRGLVI